MTTNRLAKASVGEASPRDPQDCCDWANARLHQKAVDAGLRWVPTGDTKSPMALVPARFDEASAWRDRADLA